MQDDYLRTLPHSAECGEFFCTSVHFVPTGDYSAKRLRKCERKPHNFSRELLFFPEKPVDFSPQLVHPSPHSLAICPFPHHNDKTVPPFGRKIQEKSPNRASISTIHGFSPSKTVFLTPQPHFKRLFRALFSAKRLPFVPNRHFSVTLWQKSDRQRGASYKHSLSLLFEMCRLVVLLSSHLQKTAV